MVCGDPPGEAAAVRSDIDGEVGHAAAVAVLYGPMRC